MPNCLPADALLNVLDYTLNYANIVVCTVQAPDLLAESVQALFLAFNLNENEKATMRYFFTSVLLMVAFECPVALADTPCGFNHLSHAYQFIQELEKKAPSHDGVSLRRYSLQDINHDGCMEVLESISPIEEKAVGLLNVEIYPATEWINIYSYKNGKYTEATKEHQWFLQKRKQHYKLWLRLLDNPGVLNEDSRGLLKHEENQKALVTLLKDYITRINKLVGQ